MAEEGCMCESEGLQTQLQSLISRYSSEALRGDSKSFCSDFRKLVEEYASRWQVPLPQLRILEIALCHFARASTFFASNCDHVLHTLSSLALSVFELLLFFDQKDFHQDPLKSFNATFQECNLVLARHQNVHLLQVERLVQGGGPWASLQSILSDSSLPQNEVDDCIDSELPVFFELRVRYLLSSERFSEAMALAKCCAQHPTAGQHLFFLQIYLTWLYKTSQHDRLHKEVDDIKGKDAIHIICSLECEEKDDLLLALSRAFLSQQLRRGEMYYLCDLVLIWSKLHSRLNTSKQALLEESHQLMLSATNVNSIFPFIRAILQELGEEGNRFCVELCANALQSCLPCDVFTKSLIYKTLAGLLPNDLEVCRACALLIFFLERTVDAYKLVYFLYMHPDQEYHEVYSPIGHHVRFEMLQILKKDLFFDPEFWNLIALRTNCLKLMSEKVVGAALEEIMDDKWIHNYNTKEPSFRSSRLRCRRKGAAAKKQRNKEDRHDKEDTDIASKRLKVGPGRSRLHVDHTVKRKGTQGSRPLKEGSSEPLRRSFWQLDRAQDNGSIKCGEHRRTTRLSEKNPPKRRIRKPKWLLEDSGAHAENSAPAKIKRHGSKHQSFHRSRSETGQIKNNAKHRPSVNSDVNKSENITKHQSGLSLDCLKPAAPPQVILELSLPDNELMGTFTEDSCNRHRGFPQVLFYKPTLKIPSPAQPVKTVHRKEVVLRARDAAMFLQQLHCYSRRPKGKGTGSNVRGSVSTITRSSVQGSPPKDPPREHFEKQETKGATSSQTRSGAEAAGLPVEKVSPPQSTKAASRKTSATRELSESAVERKVSKSQLLDKLSQTLSKGKVLSAVEPCERSAAENRAATASQKSAAAEPPDALVSDQAPPSQTPASELCEEPAVEMKVTIASQTSAEVSPSPGFDKVCGIQTVEDPMKIKTLAEVSQSTTADDNRKLDTEKIPVSNAATESVETGQISVSTAHALVTEAHVTEDLPASKGPCEKDTSPGGKMFALSRETGSAYSSADQDSMHDINALTLVTEMVTELPPDALARDLEDDKWRPPEYSASKESTARSKAKVPHKIRTGSGCSVPAQEASAGADAQLKKGRAETPEIPENCEDTETAPESEESKLEFSCTFCNKVFKGSRVVAHAMFHYRKDECMFCRTMFKDDLLAMMHLSNHIEKLKKSKEPASNKAQENDVSETKGISTPRTSSKDKATDMVPARRISGRTKKFAICPKSPSFQHSSPTKSRKLRSNNKPVDGQLLQEKQNASKQLHSEIPIHKLNGHISKKKDVLHMSRQKAKELDTSKEDLKPNHPLTQQISHEKTSNRTESPEVSENQDEEMDSSASAIQVEKEPAFSMEDKNETEYLQFLKAATKQHEQAVEEIIVDPHEKVHCPVDGCVWFTDLSKKRVAVLYHALEDHYGEVRPLELAFRVGNSRCSICMRVLWSFEHFQHHVERHRITPRHPCLHQGCTARFKTGIEMRRHTRRHSPLQATCCLPGCSQIFICLWALNLHEREHYASKATKSPCEQTDVKQSNAAVGRKQQDHESNDATATTAVKKTAVSLKAARKLRGQATNNSSPKRVKPFSDVRAAVLKEEVKEEANEANDSNVLKNLSNKDTAQPTVPNLRLRQTLRKGQVTNAATAAPKTHKVFSSSLLKHKSRVRHKLKRNQAKMNAKAPMRRGRPPQSKGDVPDENTSTDQNSEAVKEKAPKSPAQLSSPPKAEMTSNVRDAEQGEDVKAAASSDDESVKQKRKEGKALPAAVASHSSTPSISTAPSGRTRELSVDKMRKANKAEKHAAPELNGSQTAPPDFSKSKKRKATNGKDNTKTHKKKCALKDAESASKKSAKAVKTKSSADEDGKTKTENKESTQNSGVDPVPAALANRVNEAAAASGEKLQKRRKEEKSKKSPITKGEPKEKIVKTASSDSSGKVKKKHKEKTQMVKEQRPSKDLGKKAKVKSVVEKQDVTKASLVKSPEEAGTVKEEVSDGTLDNSGTSGLIEKTSPPTVTAEETPRVTTEKKSRKSKDGKKSDPDKVHKKRKRTDKEGNTKIVKKKCKDGDDSSQEAAKAAVPPLVDVKAEVEEGETPKESPPSILGVPGYSAMNGGEVSEDVKSSVSAEALVMYSKKPYTRPPPTAYLDEKYITMPKRRKEMSPFQLTPRSSPAVAQGCVAAATAAQRQRCANCFATFDIAEDLQRHLQLRKCSNIFGFDSDDEGNG